MGLGVEEFLLRGFRPRAERSRLSGDRFGKETRKHTDGHEQNGDVCTRTASCIIRMTSAEKNEGTRTLFFSSFSQRACYICDEISR